MAAKVQQRDKIPEQYRWKTQHLFRGDKAWEKERASVALEIVALADHEMALRAAAKNKSDDGAALLACLQHSSSIEQRLAKLTSYAARKNDEDTRVARYQAMREVAEKLATDYRAASAFIGPELVRKPKKQLDELAKDPTFSDYSYFLAETARRKPHILSTKEETLLASTSLMRDAGYNAYSAFCGAELIFPEIKDEKGKAVRLTQALFARYRASSDRDVRKATFDAFFGTFKGYSSTLASLLSAQVNANIVYARARRYPSALEAALDPDALPTSAYHKMVPALKRHRGTRGADLSDRVS
jgi:oligoendopeptidase F